MKVIRIFDEISGCVYGVQYEHEEHSTYATLFINWTDVEYLEEFFESHKNDLQSGFYGTISVEEAVLQTLDEAEQLRQRLLQFAQQGNVDPYFALQTIFKPLKNKNEHPIPFYQKTKLKGRLPKSWLRIYAIRIDVHLFVITGGAIKLTPTMNERDHLLKELEKLEIVKEYLLERDLLDKDDFVYLELE